MVAGGGVEKWKGNEDKRESMMITGMKQCDGWMERKESRKKAQRK